jgi:hypothetical protein
MPRPHEDLQRHTLTDHTSGGPIVTFAPASWWAIDVAQVTEERAPAAIASYETLIEKARAAARKAHEAAVLCSHNHRRVVALLRLDGHEAYGHLASAWDDHHLLAERHAVAESRSLALYKIAAQAGEAIVDPTSTLVCAFEHLFVGVERSAAIVTPIAAAPGFRGACVFGSDDGRASAIIYVFSHHEEVQAFRATPEAQRALGPIGGTGESFFPVRAVRTFA